MTTAPLRAFVADEIPDWVRIELCEQFLLIDELSTDIKETRAIISGSDGSANRIIGADLLNRMPIVEMIVGFGTGYDRIDTQLAWSRGITVTNTPNLHAEDVADFTIGLMIATLRQIPQADAFVRCGFWSAGPYPQSQGSLQGTTVGIIGLGAIGKAVAQRLAAFNVQIAYHGRQRQAGTPYGYYDNLRSLAEDADILVLSVPGGTSTHHLVDASVLRALGPNGYLINVSRGNVVDESALITALREGTIQGAGLDVFVREPDVSPEFFTLGNVVLQPHVASATARTRRAMWQLVIDNLNSWANGLGPVSSVPQCRDLRTFHPAIGQKVSERG